MTAKCGNEARAGRVPTCMVGSCQNLNMLIYGMLICTLNPSPSDATYIFDLYGSSIHVVAFILTSYGRFIILDLFCNICVDWFANICKYYRSFNKGPHLSYSDNSQNSSPLKHRMLRCCMHAK